MTLRKKIAASLLLALIMGISVLSIPSGAAEINRNELQYFISVKGLDLGKRTFGVRICKNSSYPKIAIIFKWSFVVNDELVAENVIIVRKRRMLDE